MKFNQNKIFKLGIFVALGIGIFVTAIYYLGKQQNLFGASIPVYTEFSNIKGLQVGNGVRFLGTSAGYVSEIYIKNDTVIRVRIMINEPMGKFIRKNSLVEIQNEGVMGSKILEIRPGTPDSPLISNNDLLPSRTTMSMEEVFSSLEAAVHNSIMATENLWEITESIKNGEGALGKFVNDNTMNESIDLITSNLISISRDARVIMDKTLNTDNDLGRLLNDDMISRRLQQTFMGLDTVMINLQATTLELKTATRALNKGDGIINKLLYDKGFATDTDTTLTRINETIDNVNETSDVIKRSWIFNLFSPGRK